MPMDMSALVQALRNTDFQPGQGPAAPKPAATMLGNAGSNLGVSPPQGSAEPMPNRPMEIAPAQVSDAEMPGLSPIQGGMRPEQGMLGGMIPGMDQQPKPMMQDKPLAMPQGQPGQMAPTVEPGAQLIGAGGQMPAPQGQPWQMNAPAQASMAVQPEMGKPLGNVPFPQAEQGYGPAPAPMPMPSMNQASQPPLNPSEQLRSQIGAAMDQFRRPPQVTGGPRPRTVRPPSAVLPRRTSVR
jgi:hypothetical protein